MERTFWIVSFPVIGVTSADFRPRAGQRARAGAHEVAKNAGAAKVNTFQWVGSLQDKYGLDEARMCVLPRSPLIFCEFWHIQW